MDLKQQYNRHSTIAADANGMRFDAAADLSRPAVSLNASIRNSLSYARCMLALYDVVSGDFRSPPPDYDEYQSWVQERYLEELPELLKAKNINVSALREERQQVTERMKLLRQEISLARNSSAYYKAQAKYYSWLFKHDRYAWILLDPVVSVHPDAAIFEVFSLDESSYGRVTVPIDALATDSEVKYGTTNVDFSEELAREFKRVRSYRPIQLSVGQDGIAVETSAGAAVEKKIDLPPSWVRGFLQVQSASAMPGVDLTLSSETVAELLSALEEKREKEGPRSIRFQLIPGKCPTLLIDPWGIEIAEPAHKFLGTRKSEIRIWGRRRLSLLKSLLPHTDEVCIRLLGTGMPSYWSIEQNGHRFDLGLSGWTRNDWSRAADFDLLMAGIPASAGDLAQANKILERDLQLKPDDLARELGISRPAALGALQKLCAQGQAMYDHVGDVFRWRRLFDGRYAVEEELCSPNVDLGRRLFDAKAVKQLERPRGDTGTSWRLLVKAKRDQQVDLTYDEEGRVSRAECTCSFFRQNGLRKGPCGHLAASLLHVAAARAAQEVQPHE